MGHQDAEHVAWRMVNDAQTSQIPLDRGVGEYLDRRVAECGGARGAVFGLVVVAGQLVQECAKATGESPQELVARLRDSHALESLEIDLREDDVFGDDT